MKNVSQDWKDNQNKSFTSEGHVRLVFDITDYKVVGDAELSGQNLEVYSNIDNLIGPIDGVTKRYGTLENNLWLLDGATETLPNLDKQTEYGYVASSMSGQDGTLDVPAMIAVTFNSTRQELLSGFTIKWSDEYNEYAKAFRIKIYNNSEVIHETYVDNNLELISAIQLEVFGYDRLEIIVEKWCLPNRRPRIAEVFIGIHKVYDKRDLIQYSHEMEMAPIGSVLPKSEIKFKLNNRDGEFNPNNVDGLYQYLSTRLEIKVDYGFLLNGEVEWIHAGKFYLSDWMTEQNGYEVSFTGQSILSFASDFYYKGKYNESGTSLYDMAIAVLKDSTFPQDIEKPVTWYINEDLKSIVTTAPLPILTHAECLQLIAQAAMKTLYVDSDGVIRIDDIGDSVDYSIDFNNSYNYPNIQLQPIIRNVDVKSYHYFTEEQTEVFKGNINVNGTQTIILEYSMPCENQSVSITGGTLVNAEYYTNVCYLTINGNGNVELSMDALPLISSSNSNILPNGNQGETQIVDNPLIDNTNWAVQVGNRVKQYLNNRQTLDNSWRADPRLEPGDVINVSHKFGNVEMIVTSITYNYTGAFKGRCGGRIINVDRTNNR